MPLDYVVGFAVRGITRSIAISSELVAGQKGQESSQARRRAEEPSDGDITENAWELEDAIRGLSAKPVDGSENSPAEDDSQDSEDFVHDHADELQVRESFTVRSLPMAVILPQRRPKDRQRGFVRAYAPILGEYSGISEDMFMDFLTSWEKASQTSPVFDVINLACFAVGMMPHAITIAVSSVVGTASTVAKEVQYRYRSNKYLDTMNETLFKPRGLIAMVMTFRPDLPDDPVLQADTTDPTSTTLTKVLGKQNSNKFGRMLYRLRNTSGVAKGEAQLPDCAPLVYPALDLALTSTAVTKTNALKKNAAVVQDYLDRRAQAEFVVLNPNSKIAKALPPQEKPFVNRFCDPDHPVNNGSVMSLMTGGKLDFIGMGRVQRSEWKAKRDGQPPLTEKERHDAFMGRRVRGYAAGTPSKHVPIISNMLRKDVLYLVIVNLPTEEEMARIRQEIRVQE